MSPQLFHLNTFLVTPYITQTSGNGLIRTLMWYFQTTKSGKITQDTIVDKSYLVNLECYEISLLIAFDVRGGCCRLGAVEAWMAATVGRPGCSPPEGELA